MIVSAGILMYRRRDGIPEVFLVHPGGPFWKNKDEGAWSIPKGEAEEGEELIEVARREFMEETGFQPGELTYLTSVKNIKSGKVVEVWMFEGNADPRDLKSNTISIDWPPRSERKLEIPEVDRGDFFIVEEAKKKIIPYQLGIVEAFEREYGGN